MAWLESRNGSWRVAFRYKEGRHAFTLGEVSAADALAHKVAAEELLRLLHRNLVSVPAGCTIEDFLLHRGKPPVGMSSASQIAPRKGLTLTVLLNEYLGSQKKKLEGTTLSTAAQHFAHFLRLLGNTTEVSTVSRADVQSYVDRRAAEWIDRKRYRRQRRKKAAAKPKRKYVRKGAPPKVEAPDRPRRHPSPATLRREMASFRAAWNWARLNLGLVEEFPGAALDYAKGEVALPFMSWAEAERRVAAGDDPEKVWDCLYLKPAEVAELLAWVKGCPMRPWVYPMVCLAAHTGARRSEIVRALPSEVDLQGEFFTVREKKKDRRKLTTRRVPLTPLLKEVLAVWLQERGRGKTLFCKDDGAEVTPREAQNYLRRAPRPSKWRVVKGWHTLRHSFCSALASRGVDQRVIDEMMGHSTEQQRRRYRHLFPEVTKAAVQSVFG